MSNQNPEAAKKQQRMDFVPTKPMASPASPEPNPAESGQETSENPSVQHPTYQAEPIAPVMSAKAAINAMYAARANQPATPMATSAREAVNAAASQAQHQTKSASNLHRGKIQKSMESTRTSASSILRRASGEQPKASHLRPAGSFDPLARSAQGVRGPASPSRPGERNIQVVHTSLKLGSAARPKQDPVVLPANSRMVRQARPVGPGAGRRVHGASNVASLHSGNSNPNRLAKLLEHQAIDAQMIQPGARTFGAGDGMVMAKSASASPALGSGAQAAARANAPSDSDHEGALEVQILTGHSDAPATTSTSAASAKVRRPTQLRAPSRDPQMLGHTKLTPAPSQPHRATDMITAQMGQPRRFRPAPKGFAATKPTTTVSPDNAYVMSEPPKILGKKRPSAVPEPLGVVEDYHATNPPQPLGDKAPIGRITEQRVASGHGGAAPFSAATTKFMAPAANFAPNDASEHTTIKADNTSNYSFSHKASTSDTKSAETKKSKAGAAPIGQSAFLKSVNVEKRPLSNNAKPRKPSKIEASPKPAPKPSRKNFYPKPENPAVPGVRQDLPTRPTVIVPAGRRSKAPLFFLIIITIILGAAVGAAAYLCFFQ